MALLRWLGLAWGRGWHEKDVDTTGGIARDNAIGFDCAAVYRCVGVEGGDDFSRVEVPQLERVVI